MGLARRIIIIGNSPFPLLYGRLLLMSTMLESKCSENTISMLLLLLLHQKQETHASSRQPYPAVESFLILLSFFLPSFPLSLPLSFLSSFLLSFLPPFPFIFILLSFFSITYISKGNIQFKEVSTEQFQAFFFIKLFNE